MHLAQVGRGARDADQIGIGDGHEIRVAVDLQALQVGEINRAAAAGVEEAVEGLLVHLVGREAGLRFLEIDGEEFEGFDAGSASVPAADVRPVSRAAVSERSPRQGHVL